MCGEDRATPGTLKGRLAVAVGVMLLLFAPAQPHLLLVLTLEEVYVHVLDDKVMNVLVNQ